MLSEVDRLFGIDLEDDPELSVRNDVIIPYLKKYQHLNEKTEGNHQRTSVRVSTL
jgi:hypothetical protein